MQDDRGARTRMQQNEENDNTKDNSDWMGRCTWWKSVLGMSKEVTKEFGN